MPNFRVNVGFSWLHTRIEDPNVFAQVGAANGVPSETVLNPLVRVGNNYFAQVNGNAFPDARRYNVNIDARYDLPLGGGDNRLFVAADFDLQGETYFTLYRSVEYRADGNYELGGKVGHAFKRCEVAAFVRNLTNAKTWST